MATTFLPTIIINGSYSYNDTNSSALTDQLNPFYFYQTEEIVFLALLFIFIVTGNSIVLLALGLSKRTHSRMHFFIMHLALADLSVGLITVLGDLIWKITIKWYAGVFVCKMLKFAQAFVMFASSYMLVALSIDRYDAIARPLSFSTTWTRCKVLVGVAWGLSALFSVPLFIFSGVPDGTLACWLQFPDDDYPWIWTVYFVGVMAAVLILPALIIAGCYTLIIIIIWKNSHLLDSARPKQVYTAEKKFLVASSHDTIANNGCTPTGSPKTNRVRSGVSGGRSSKGIIPQAKIRTIKMTFTIVSAFILCWSPYFVFNLLSILGYIPRTQATIATHTFIQSLAPLNSAANPIIYGIFSTRICRYLRQLKMFRWLSSVCCCQDGQTPRNSGFSEVSNYTDACGDFVRRSPRNVNEYPRRSPRNSEDFLCKPPRTTLTANDNCSVRTPHYVSIGDYSNKRHLRSENNIEMCDFILIAVKRDGKLS